MDRNTDVQVIYRVVVNTPNISSRRLFVYIFCRASGEEKYLNKKSLREEICRRIYHEVKNLLITLPRRQKNKNTIIEVIVGACTLTSQAAP